jgi:hypothetical protein
MILTDEQRAELEEASKPLIKFLAQNFHPHVKVIVDCGSAELLESSARIVNDEFIVD